MILHYLKIAFRNLCKHKTQNIISIIGLAVGLLCFCICLYCGRFVESTDHCFANYDRITELSLYDTQADRFFSGTPTPLSEELRTWHMEEAEALSCITFPRERPYNVELSADKTLPYELETIEVDTCYDKVFTPKMVAGHWKMASRSPNSVILSQSTAIKIFGNVQDAIGKHMTLMRRLSTSPGSTPHAGGIVYTIQAVMEDIPLNNSFNFMQHTDALTVNDSEGLFQYPKRSAMTGAQTYALLSPQTSIKALESRISQRNYTYTLYDKAYTVSCNSMGGLLKKQGASYLTLITGVIGALILLVGLINFFHFLIGSFFNRTKEFSIMKMTGCNWKQLFCLLFTQSLIVILISSVLVLWGIELLGNRMNISLPGLTMIFAPELLLKHALQYVGFLILLCVAICLVVSVRIRQISVQTGIYGSNKRRGKQWGRNFMLGMQFFICWIFVSLTAALYLQSEKTSATLFHTLSREEKAEILSIPLEYPFMKNEDKLALIERFRQHAGVKDILLSDVNYAYGGVSGNMLMTEKGNDNSWINIDLICVPSNFFNFMNIPVEQGRLPQTEQDIIVDRVWQDLQKKDVIGTNFYDRQHDYTVCGVCAPFQAGVYNKSGGYAFMPYNHLSIYIGHCYIKCQPGQLKEVSRWVEAAYREMLPENITFQSRTFLDDIHNVQAVEYNLKDVILFFAIVSIIITLLGVYSSITLDTERRQKEVAIRKVNGAAVPQIILLFARRYVLLLLCSAVVAFPLVYATLTLWKRMYTVFFTYGFLFWSGIFLTVAFITGITILFRILRIARMNPAKVIKNE